MQTRDYNLDNTTNLIKKRLFSAREASEKCFLVPPGGEVCKKAIKSHRESVEKYEAQAISLSSDEEVQLGQLNESSNASGICRAFLRFSQSANKDTFQMHDYCQNVNRRFEDNLSEFIEKFKATHKK